MKIRLESLYHIYNNPSYIHPDPLEHVRRYPLIQDREIAGVIASSLAFGRVAQILAALSRVFQAMGDSPFTYLVEGCEKTFNSDFKGFVYRFVRAEHLVGLLMGLQQIVDTFGSLERCFVSDMSRDDETVYHALCRFSDHLVQRSDPGYLVARPGGKSAMKRMNLFLRWMVRQDRVDPGGWEGIEPSMLIVPLDTHMHRIATQLGLTCRKQADMKTALEITGAFRAICPHDPVRYDFTLTRFGIRRELDPSLIWPDHDKKII